MCLLLESIRIYKNKPQHLFWHEQRLNRSRRELLGSSIAPIKLTEVINCSNLDERVIYKARLFAKREVEKVEIVPYQKKLVQSIKLVEAGDFTYDHKFADRSGLEQLFAQKEMADDVLIMSHGLIRDTSYANVCFWDGKQWFTPASPLLAGTRRASLLASGEIRPAIIRPEDLPAFEKVCLINAMLGLGEVVVPVKQIVY